MSNLNIRNVAVGLLILVSAAPVVAERASGRPQPERLERATHPKAAAKAHRDDREDHQEKSRKREHHREDRSEVHEDDRD